jgi:hypothetical protein
MNAKPVIRRKLITVLIALEFAAFRTVPAKMGWYRMFYLDNPGSPANSKWR